MTAKGRLNRAAAASVFCLLAAGAVAQSPPRPQPEANVGIPQRMLPSDQRFDPLPVRDVVAPAGGNRLSPEERRQLRRDVHEAGRDIYSDKERSSRREQRGQ